MNSTESKFSFQPITHNDVSELINNLNDHKAAGFDGITSPVLKKFNVYLSNPLSSIFNRSLKESSVPTLWKAAVVSPIQKKKGDISLGNFRPISVLPTLSKLLENSILSIS